MNEIVFIGKKDVPYTTSKIISDWTGIEHRKIKAAIRKYKQQIDFFGLSAPYQAESTGGRPEEIYLLTEEQATFLMTLLKNTEIVVEFKKELVRQFYAMREELNRAKVAHAAKNPIRRAMTDALQEHLPESPHKQKQFGNYTDLTYRAVFGKTARRMREELGLKKRENLVPYMTSEQLAAIAKVEEQVAVLTDLGLSYQQIKEFLLMNVVPSIAKTDG